MDIFEIRRKNLNALIDSMGGQAVFIDRTNRNQGQTSALQNGGRNIGEKLARKIEKQCGIPDKSLDRADGLNQDPMEAIEQAINSAHWLDDADKRHFLGLLKGMRGKKQ